ncbi:MAG: dihydrolipoyl dehydrogenase [Bacteroidetes bacterium]|nr:dihydrolipoyl dehydrogenase [Bacteroidota bacterium]
MQYDIVIIGSGPAGYVTAIRAGQLGLKTAIIEKDKIGGMCLNWGCIPSKSILESAKVFQKVKNDAASFGVTGFDKKNIGFDWKQSIKRTDGIVRKLGAGINFLFKKNGVELISGTAKIMSENSVLVDNRLLETKNILIATGSRQEKINAKLPEGLVVEIADLFRDREIPENIVVLGQNTVAVELAQFFNLIEKKVTLLVPGSNIMPLADSYVREYMKNLLTKSGVKIIYDVDDNLSGFQYKDGALVSKDMNIPCDFLLNSKMRKGTLPESDINLTIEDGFIKTDDDFTTNFPSVYAIGDVNGKSFYAHIASAEGLHVVNHIKGITEKIDLKKFPLNMYTVPEVAQIGETEDELKASGADYKVSEYSMFANGKAMIEGENTGFVRILSDTKYGEVLGVQIVASNATDMIAEAGAFMQVESTIYDIAKTVHAHPTISEVFMEAGIEGSK